MEAGLERMNERHKNLEKLHELIINRFKTNLDNLIPSLENFKNEVKKKFPQLTSTKSKKQRTLSEKIVKHFEKREEKNTRKTAKREAKKIREEYNKKSIIKRKKKPSEAEKAAKLKKQKKEADKMIASYESLNP